MDMVSPPERIKKRHRTLSVPTVLFKFSRASDSKTFDSNSFSPLSTMTSSPNPAFPSAISTKQALQLRANMLPYRENGVLKYIPAPSPPPTASSSAVALAPPSSRLLDQISLDSCSSSEFSSAQHVGGPSFNTYDSDCEPLMGERESDVSMLDADALMRFTATGRPMPSYKPSAMANMSGSMYIAPQHLPQRYTDESIIPVIVKLQAPRLEGETGLLTSRRKSFLGKLKGGQEKRDCVKVVYMPRGEYLKYFARDRNANYIGSAPEHQWTEGELDEKYGKYKKFQA